MSTHFVIVNYNSGDWLSRSLHSVITFTDAEITVVDNASTDNSVVEAKCLLEKDMARISWIENADNRGFAAANNQVLQGLTTDYAVLMNPDCELRHDTMEHMQRAFQSCPGFGLASGRILNEDGSLQTTCRRKFPTPWSAMVRMLKLSKLFPNNPRFEDFDYGDSVDADDPVQTVEAISGAFMMVRATAMAEVGMLDEGYFMHCEDLDWCKRFQLANWQVGFVPQAEILHAKGVSSQSRPIRVLWTLHKGMVRFFDKFYRKDTNWLLRLMVKTGVYVSFLVRAVVSAVRRGGMR